MPRTPVIQAVTLDVGGTLITPHPSVGAIYARVAARQGGRTFDPALLDTRFRQRWSAQNAFTHTREEWERLVDEVFAGLTPEPPSQTFFPELYDEFSRPEAWQVYPDVIPTLEALAAAGLDLGIVSNWDERLRPLLKALRLDRYFNGLAVSCETGFAKPSVVIFEEALRQLGRPAASVLHVGDGLREDFAGATAAGLSALHLRRDAPGRDLQIHSLSEIPEWIQGGEAPPSSQGARTRSANFLSPDG